MIRICGSILLMLVAGVLFAAPEVTELPLSPGDKMKILYYEDAVSATEPTEVDAVVDQQGNIFMPMLGEVSAEGLTPAQLEKHLVLLYGAFVEKPLVSVRLEYQLSRAAYLLGAVVQQGAYQVESDATLSRFLAEHGGLSGNADLLHVRVMRSDGKQVVVNVSHIFSSGDEHKDVQVFPGDRIFVPTKGNTSLDRAARLIQIATMVLQAAIFVLVLTR